MKPQRQPHAPASEGAINRIGELAFCFDVSEASQQLGAPEKLLMAVRAELLDIVDSTLADAARGRNDIQLEKLEFDLGAFPDPPDWQHVRTTLRERLLAELTPYLYPASATPVAAEKTQRMPERTTAANLPNASSEGMNSDFAPTPPDLTASAARASGSKPPSSDAALPLFRSTREMPHHLSAGKSAAQGRAKPDADHELSGQRIFRFTPIRPASPEPPEKPATGDREVPLVRSIAETLHDMADGRSDVSPRERLLAELRWRRQNAPARLHAELAALPVSELLQVSRVLGTGGGFGREEPDGMEASLTGDTPVRKRKLINRIERALEPKGSSPAAQTRTTELTAALRGLFADAALSQPDPQRLSTLAKSTLQFLADAITPTRVVPQGAAPSDPDDHLAEPDLTRMSIAELRAEIDRYLPKSATELSAAIDQLGATSADHTEALRVVAQALLDGKPIDLEHARHARRDEAYDDGGAASAIMNLLRAVNVPDAEIVAFTRARPRSKSARGGTDGVGTRSEGPSSPNPAPHLQSPRPGSMKTAPSSSGRDPASTENAGKVHRKQSETSLRGHDDTPTVSPDTIGTKSPEPPSPHPREGAPGASAESDKIRPAPPEPPQEGVTQSENHRIGTPAAPIVQGNEHDHEPTLRRRAGSSKDKPNALTETSAEPVQTPDRHTAQSSPAMLRKVVRPGASEALNIRTDAGRSGKRGPFEGSLTDTEPDESATPERKLQADDDTGAAEGASINTDGMPSQIENPRRDTGKLGGVMPQDTLPGTSTPADVPNNTGTTASDNPEPISDPYPPDAALNQDPSKHAQSSSDTSPEDQFEEPLATPRDKRNTQMSERRLGDLFDAAAIPDAPRLREMFELIWRALPDVTGADGQDRIRYWQAALVAVLSTPRGHSAPERATDAFLAMAEPDDASRHNLLRVLLARLGYGQPGSDPTLRREACAILENLLAGGKVAPVAAAKTDPDASFVPTAHAGLVIFHPYLPMLFDRMTLLTPQKYIRPEQLPRAAAALAALADATPAPSVVDPLERLLLAMPDGAELVPEALPDSDLSLIDSLLRSVLAQWPRLGQTSPTSLCETFIRRTGILQIEGETPRLLVDDGPYDMLLDGLPWTLSPVALPWMTVPLTVIWRQGND